MFIKANISLSEFEACLSCRQVVEVEKHTLDKLQENHRFLVHFAKDSVVYGINTGFGPMAQYPVSDEHLSALQYNLIRSHATGAGQPLEPVYVRAALLARLMTFLQVKSGVGTELIDIMLAFLNHNIVPYVPEHGGVGASGDLVQLAHIALTFIGEGEVFYDGKRQPTQGVLQQLGIKPLTISLREGLAICNGTSVMTGIGLVNLLQAKKLLSSAVQASVMLNEIAGSYDDCFAMELNRAKHHRGQQSVAAQMREYAEGSLCLKKRHYELYGNSQSPKKEKALEQKVQPYYSLRCVPQILGPISDTLDYAEKILVDEINSACDNPIIDDDSEMIYHGGNFHGDYVSFEMDKLKIAITKLTMLLERQLNYLLHDKINDLLPPFVNHGILGLNYGMQACQFTATSTTAESQTLSNPMYVHSIPCNNDNQDIVSMGTNASLMTKKVIENAYQVLSIYLIAGVQAVDWLKIAEKISAPNKKFYQEIRNIVPLFIQDEPKYKAIAAVTEYLQTR